MSGEGVGPCPGLAGCSVPLHAGARTSGVVRRVAGSAGAAAVPRGVCLSACPG